MTQYGVYTRNCAGVTIYHLGMFESAEQAKQEAKEQYAWYTSEPIVEMTA